MLQTATDATTNARRWSMIPDHAQNPKSNLQKGSEAAGNGRIKIIRGFFKAG